jgi:hypothetical protein
MMVLVTKVAGELVVTKRQSVEAAAEMGKFEPVT